MGKHKKWYYGVVKKIICTAYTSKEKSPVVIDTQKAIAKAYNELELTEDGEIKQRIVKDILLTGRETYVSLSMKAYVTERTQMRVVSDFVYQVAEILGYEEISP